MKSCESRRSRKRRAHRIGFCVAAGMLALALGACKPKEVVKPSVPRNVLLISVDTLRADHLGAYGYARDTSPNIDQLAARGVVFDRMTSVSSWTLPSHVSMMTGKYPSFHAVKDHGVKLAPEIPTLAEAFRDRGYQTLGVTSHVYVSSAFGLERGFSVFDDWLPRGGLTNPKANAVVDKFLRHVDGLSGEAPFFGFVHFFDPHWNYIAPPPFYTKFTDPEYDGLVDGTYSSLRRYFFKGQPMPEADLQQAIALYDGEIAFLDQELGRLFQELDARGLLENTIIVLTSDHGEEFKEHGQLGHAKTLYQEQIFVPLIIAGHPGLVPGARRADLCSTIDLARTLLSLVGETEFGEFGGVPLFLEKRDSDAVVFSETIRFGLDKRAVSGERYKVISQLELPHLEFFDLANDPGEQARLNSDPSHGTLVSSLEEFELRADHGWHLKMISVGKEELRVRATLETTGRFIRPRYYFSDDSRIERMKFHTFVLDPDEKSLRFDVKIAGHAGEVVFETDPSDAEVRLRIDDVQGPEDFGVFLGDGSEGPVSGEIQLQPSDPRLESRGYNPIEARAGFYLRVVGGERDPALAVELPEEARENLRALGYLDDEPK